MKIKALNYKTNIYILFILLFFSITATTPSLAATKSSDETVPDSLIFFERGKEPEYALLVEKKAQRIYLYELNSTFNQVLSMKCSTGEANGPKEKSGDRKTPEGVYFFTKESTGKYLTATYGTRAFPTDYPHILDRIEKKTGNSIWMHGTDKVLKDRDSNGCIVLKNDDIDALSQYILIRRTPIIITESVSYVSIKAQWKTKLKIISLLNKWNNAVTQGAYHDYLAMYSPSFLPDIEWWRKWTQLKDRLKSDNIKYSLELTEKYIMKHNDTYVAIFNQKVKTKDRVHFAGTRKFFIKQTDNALKIVGEEYLELPRSLTMKGAKKAEPIVAVTSRLVPQPVKENSVPDFVNSWLRSWTSKNIKAYGKCYSAAFASRGMGKSEWLKYKRRLNRQYKYIKVSQKNLKVSKNGDTATAIFKQIYKTNTFKAVGIKTLILKRENEKWKIFRETWKKM